ncbi:MurT ligase domain-containing protein [Pediococcus siamensis]|uniref:MurT ligase domain-containing protein n=1 Tax=Pediococcus siamensis TaxID=381829 RepID=UPI0039A17F0C
MSLKSSLAIATGKSAYWFLHKFRNGGSSLPGKLTTKIDPDILKVLGKNYDVIVITGTNGKTLTTALTVKVLNQKFPQVLTNPSGSNMEQGIVTTFLTAKKSKNGRQIAVLEVDEANVIKVTKYIKPLAFVFTNIFRDQMDRYGEIYTTYQKILDGVALAPEATIIANGDASIFNSKQLPNPIQYYGFNNQPDGETMAAVNTDGILCPVCQHILHYKSIVYSNLGKYYCPNCGFKRPELTYQLTSIDNLTPATSAFTIDHTAFTLHIGGLYNVYNALAAYAVGRFMGVAVADIQTALNDPDERVFGRQEQIQVGDKEITIVLVKNPVGLNQVIDMVGTEKEPFSLVGLLNANYADGIDTSWIWDGEFEKLPKMNIKQFMTGGERYKDITFRLKVAGVPEDRLTVTPSLQDAIEKFKDLPTKRVYVFATYTAMIQLRKQLAEDGYIKEGI